MSDTMNMKSITIKRFLQLVEEQLEDGDLTPILGLGKSGVGKTVGIYELTQKLGIGFCELRLVTLTETDMLGVPMIENGRTTYASNELLPMASRDGERGVLVLDEITSAMPGVRAAAFQLLDSKRSLGNYKLPPDWLVVSLGNGISDGGVFQGMELAFLNRCRCYRIEPDLASWKNWAIDNDINESVTGFVSFKPEMLHKFDPDELASVFPSPRSWEALSKQLTNRERRKGGKLDSDSVELYASGCVGEECAVQFAAFYEYNKKVLNAEDILAGTAPTDLKDMEAETRYILAASITKTLKSECNKEGLGDNSQIKRHSELADKVGNVFKWTYGVSKNTALDLAIMIVKDIANNIPCIEATIVEPWWDEDYPEFVKFASENENVF